MRDWLTAASMAFGMFCAIPLPFRRWDEAQRGRMLVLLPWVGAVTGGLWALAAWLLRRLGLHGAPAAAILTVLPLGLTGFIHLDGFLDCCDAIYSRREAQTRRKILKDPHCGAFAVIHLAVYLLLFYAAMHTAGDRPGALVFVPVAVRCVTALAVAALRPMDGSQYARRSATAGQRAALSVFLAVAVALPPVLFGLPGLCAAVAAAVAAVQVRIGVRQLGGMSGDISGFAIARGELAGVWALAVLLWMEGLWF